MPNSPKPRDPLATPFYVKTSHGMALPADPYYRLLTASGVMIGRSTPFFSSLVPARDWDRGLATQQPVLALKFPRIPAADFARIVGFADHFARGHGAEIIVHLFWDRERNRHQFVVPEQVSAVSVYSDGVFPSHLEYSLRLEEVPPTWQPMGTIHSHVYMGSHPSHVDVNDEKNAGGCHIIIGRLDQLPALPQVHVDFVVDGMRFNRPASEVIEIVGFSGAGKDYPQTWIDRVSVRRLYPRPMPQTPVRNRQQARSWQGTYPNQW